jgi:RNA polymerase sigma-70 factor (ECF subfamily)
MTDSAVQGTTFPEPAAHGATVSWPRPDRDGGRADPLTQAYIAALYASHRRALRAFVARFLSNDDDIADTVQDVFVRIVQLCEPCKIERNPRAYLFTTAHHLVVDRIRQARSRKLESHVSVEDIELPSATPAPDDALHWQQMLACLSEELRRTGKQVAAVVELSCTENLTQAQIARALGVTTRTVERHMREAREMVGGLLACDAAAVVPRYRTAC